MHYKRAKMTAKAKEAIATYAAVHNISISDVRTDRPAIRGIYAELEENGYVWRADKQAWAFIQTTESVAKTLVFSLSADAVDFENARYIVSEGLRAAGYQILSEMQIVSPFDTGVSSSIIEVVL